ncbi:type II secretion system protein [bacterium]|nr:type II secretion system protein [bacterium]
MNKRFGFTLAEDATHADMSNKLRRSGFTLAEVLITLGIIGVVAAMTIPTLIANTNSAKFRSQYKKTLSTLNQAGLMAQAQYDIDYGATTAACSAPAEGSTAAKGANDNPDSKLTFCAILNGTLAGATDYGTDSTKVSSKGGTYTWVKTYTIGSSTSGTGEAAVTTSGVTDAAPSGYIMYGLADGSLIGFPEGAKGCTLAIGTPLTNDQLKSGGSLNGCIGFIDVNGATLPNKEVACGTGSATITPPTLNPESPCTVGADANHMTDIYPVVFHDATVEPATNAAKYVLTTSK